MQTETLNALMKRALELAAQGGRATAPNPMVGAVIFNDDGKIVSEGWHKCCGQDHAEVDALRKIDFNGKNLNMAVTLEPCNHYGKTPPCTEAIIKAGIKKVYIGAREANKKACNGACKLEEHGIATEFLTQFEREVHEQNRYFFKAVIHHKPYITVKCATSIDGAIAPASGDSRYISSDASLKLAHELRAAHMAVAIGGATLVSDDPALSIRLVEGIQPRPVVYSRHLSIPENRKLYERGPIIFTSSNNKKKIKRLTDNGCYIELLPDDPYSITNSLKILWEKYRIHSLLVEGGGKLIGSFHTADEIDEIVHVVAPFFMGGGIPMFSAQPLDSLSQRRDFSLHEISTRDSDAVIIYRRQDLKYL